ncbi:MAG: FKBP-type peptidyl-prolyl cis-trans isomerase [Lachnospiraceae bacterium]|nr:FKBP-type peptidyl-prolyl cis-trans isomerase [Lachnospiraceae bacterium]
MSEENISKSKQKREARKQEVKKEKAKRNIGSVISWCVGLVIAAIVIGVIGMGIYTSLDQITPSSDFSRYLDENGFIEGADLSSVKDLDMTNLHIALSDVDYTDEEIEKDVSAALSSKASYLDDASLTVKDGDSINLDYVGYVDGVAFEGGDTKGNGTTLTIGSGSYIDDFEEQLIGSHPGDSVTVNVTFPEGYSEELGGKDAVFECVVNSILVTPELTDEFVQENFPEYGSTVEEFRNHYKAEGYDNNLRTYLTQYISDNAEAAKLPGKYTKHSRSTIAYTDRQSFEYISQVYQLYGMTPPSSFQEYTGMSDADYNAHVKEEAKKRSAIDMAYEKIFKDNNLTIDEEYLESIRSSYSDEETAEFGDPYFKQLALKTAVVNFLVDAVTVE